ncbi:MAG TPA: HAD hydrolase-like protein [bacterium]|nr:HAD hydrolase-like protein [bacterium]
MKKKPSIACLFVDIGGVLLTNGWDHQSRKRAAARFKLNWTEFENRHHLHFDTYEQGKLSLEQYLSRVVFHQKRNFTKIQFRNFMFSQSKPFNNMIELMVRLKALYGLKIIVVSNEGRELNVYRIKKFELNRFVDSFISSSFVHLRKPDEDIFRLALDVAQTPLRQSVYIENTEAFVKVAEGLGIQSILHQDYETTREKLALFGLPGNHHE